MKKLYLIIILALIVINGKGQTGVTTYTIPTAFSGGLRYCLKVDTHGNKWFGTNRGLIKFDGTTYTQYDTLNGLPDEVVNDVAFDGSNNMWVGTRKGLTKYNGTTWTTYDISNSTIPNDTVNCISFQGTTVYVGTDNGVGKLSGTTWTTYNSSNSGFSTRKVNCMAVDLINDLYVGTNVGLYRKSGTVWTDLATINPYYSYIIPISSIYVDASNVKWVGESNYNLIFTLSGNSLVNIIDTYNNCGTDLSKVAGHSIVKGPRGGVMFGNTSYPAGLIEIVNGQVYNYSGLNFAATYFANDNPNGLIWGIPYTSSNHPNYSKCCL